jgi:outer membrane protein assembly factor BamB
MKNIGIALLSAALLLGAAHASEADALLKATGKGGGICVLFGQKDLTLARGLAEKGSFFVQVLEPDARKAQAWSAEVADGKLREKLCVVDREFDPGHYASALLNMVVAGRAPNGKLGGLVRALAPGGVLAVRGGGGAFAKSGLEKLSGVAGWTLLRKPPGPVNDWAPTDSLRWRAGGRYHQISYSDFPSVAFGSGKLVYREGVGCAGGGNRFELVCRDACNGRVLWRIEEEPFGSKDWGGYLRYRMGLAVGENGRVYTGLGKEFVCLDAETGKVLSKLGQRPRGSIRIHKGKVLVAGGGFYDLGSGRKLGSYGGGRTAIVGDALYSMTGRTVAGYRIPDGKLLWKADVRKGQPGGQVVRFFASEKAVHVNRIWPSSLASMDLKTGKVLWSFPKKPPRSNSCSYWAFGDRILAPAWELKKKISEPHDFVVTMLDAGTGKVVKDHLYPKGKHWAGGCWGPRKAGDYLVYHHNVWFNLKTGKRSASLLVMPKCAQGPLPSGGLLYAFPGRKAGAVKGIAALAPRDVEFGSEPGGKVLKRLGASGGGGNVSPTDWPMFRGGSARGNSTKVSLGGKLVRKWEATVGLGGQTYGRMDSERTGLSQATSAWGMVFVSDLDGGRVVALNAADGREKWSYHVGSRVSFSPTLYGGLCLFGAKDGWVYCLNAKTGKAVYKLMIAPRERYIGGQEKLESMWPVCGDVFVNGGVAYASAGVAASIHGGIRVVAFDPGSGRVIWARCIQGKPSRNEREAQPGLFVFNPRRKLVYMGFTAFEPRTGKSSRAHRDKGILRAPFMEDWLSTNNLSRLCEDMGGVGIGDGRVHGRLIAFNASFGMGFSVARVPKRVHHMGTITLAGKSTDGKTKWAHATNRLNVDDLLLSADRAYCAGHYVSGNKPPELREISLADGKILATHELKCFPTYNGTSVAGKRLFIATREGRLICFEGK